MTISINLKGRIMKNEILTKSKLVSLTGAKPYQISYLHSIGKLPVIRDAQGAGIPIIYSHDSIDIVKAHLHRSAI